MRYLRTYKKFTENAYVSASTAGSGSVVAAQPGSLPGTFGTDGSGDIGFTFKKEKRKKGDVTEVSDLRDLEEVEIEKVDDIKIKN
jgi:hypothetical protein